MTGTDLFDCLAEQKKAHVVDRDNAETMRALADQMVAAAIASVKSLRTLRPLMFPVDATPERLAVAKALRAEFEQWVADAEAVYQRSLALSAVGIQVANLSELNDFIGLTLAMLTVTLESHLKSLQGVANAKVMTMEELRRELHLPPKR
jgi:hypothetical protein